MKVAYNREGSNQIQGVATLVLSHCNLKGQVQADVLLIESDERYARFTFRHFSPTHFVITNLCRDQMTRNGHPEWIYDIINQSVALMGEGTNFVLNADDPLVSRFGQGKAHVTWFGVGEIPESHQPYHGLYDDGARCPLCKGRMVYHFRHYGNMGDYVCQSCGYRRAKPQFEVTNLQLSRGFLTINNTATIHLALKSMYNVYNVLAAFAVGSLLGVSEQSISDSVSDYVLTNGRVVSFHMGERHGLLLTSKHENSTSYNQSIQMVTAPGRDCTVMIIVQAISRKYFTSDTSWLWDIDFENLNVPCVKKILLAGTYCWDLAARFDYTGIDPQRIVADPSIQQAMELSLIHICQRSEKPAWEIFHLHEKYAIIKTAILSIKIHLFGPWSAHTLGGSAGRSSQKGRRLCFQNISFSRCWSGRSPPAATLPSCLWRTPSPMV